MKLTPYVFKVVAVSLCLLISPLTHALQMEPLSLVLKPVGAGTNQVFRVVNESNKPIAVQFSMTTRAQINNQEVRRPADDLFMIYPPQVIIPAKAAQKVRVQWLGETALKTEKAYRLIAEQVHIPLSKEQTGVTMLMKVVAALYVQPNNAKSDVMVKTVKPHGKQLGITIDNSGNRHKILKIASLTLKSGQEAIQLQGNQLLGLQGKNVLANSSKRFFIKKPDNYRDAVWTASLTYSQ